MTVGRRYSDLLIFHRLLRQARPYWWHLAAGLLLAVTLLRYCQMLASWMLQTYTGEKLLLEFRARLFRHVQHLSLSYHDARGTADSLYRIQYDAPAIQHIMVNGIIPSIAAACTLVGMVCVTARLDPQL